MESVPVERPLETEMTGATKTQKTPYRWIQARIESLDPYKDYEEIFRLTSSYNLNDFVNNLTYGIILPTLLRPEWAARAIWREDGGKILNKAHIRVEDTYEHNMSIHTLTLYYDPNH